MQPVVLVIDGGTESVRVALICVSTGKMYATSSASYPTHTPANGWAEQDPDDWWEALAIASQSCLSQAPKHAHVIALTFATTTCTLLPIDKDGRSLGRALLWSDVRAATQAERIWATGHPAVKRVSGSGFSAEWMLAKALWLHDERPHLFHRTARFAEYGDWIFERLTGVVALSANTVTQRWLYDNSSGTKKDPWPTDLFNILGLQTLRAKLSPVLQVGEEASRPLSKQAADALGLTAHNASNRNLGRVRVFMGGGDAFVGLLGMGVCDAGTFGLMTGSSNVLSGFTANPGGARQGVFGPFSNALVPGLRLVEGGQPATGSMLRSVTHGHTCHTCKHISTHQVVSTRARWRGVVRATRPVGRGSGSGQRWRGGARWLPRQSYPTHGLAREGGSLGSQSRHLTDTPIQSYAGGRGLWGTGDGVCMGASVYGVYGVSGNCGGAFVAVSKCVSLGEVRGYQYGWCDGGAILSSRLSVCGCDFNSRSQISNTNVHLPLLYKSLSHPSSPIPAGGADAPNQRAVDGCRRGHAINDFYADNGRRNGLYPEGALLVRHVRAAWSGGCGGGRDGRCC